MEQVKKEKAEIEKLLQQVQKYQKLKKGDGAVDKGGMCKYRVTGKDTVRVIGAAKKGKTAKTLTIYSTVRLSGKVYKVTAVGDNAFKGNKYATKIVMGKNITKIGKHAFDGCKKVKLIKIKSKKLKYVRSYAFKNIYSKAVIKVPSSKLKAYTKLIKNSKISKNVGIKKI